MQNNYNLADFLDDLTDAFLPMRHVDEESRGRWTAVVHKKLSSYSSAALKRGADDIISNRKSRGFPSMAEMIDACAKATRIETANKPKILAFDQLEGAEGVMSKWDAGEERCNFLLLENIPTIAVKAAKEGWVGCLWAFVRAKGRLPHEWEVDGIRKEAKQFDRAYADCVRGGFNDAKRLENLGSKMIERREKLRSIILGAAA